MDKLDVATHLLAARIKAGDNITDHELRQVCAWADELIERSRSHPGGAVAEARDERPATASIAFSMMTQEGGYMVELDAKDKFADAYPKVDIDAEFKKMSIWLDTNPAKRKTRRGMPRFINSWLSRAQAKADDKKIIPSGAEWRPRPVEDEPEIDGLFGGSCNE